MTSPTVMQVQLLSLDEVVTACDLLARRILASNFRPDMIVAIARGGFAPARFLCDFLDIGALGSIRVEHYRAGARKGDSARVTIPLAASVEGKRVLLVDDVNDTGDTLAAATPYLNSLGPRELRTAVLHEKANTAHNADFRAGDILQWRWMLYPWALVEDVGQFIREMDPPPADAGVLGDQLRNRYGLALTPEQLARVVRFNRLPDDLMPPDSP